MKYNFVNVTVSLLLYIVLLIHCLGGTSVVTPRIEKQDKTGTATVSSKNNQNTTASCVLKNISYQINGATVNISWKWPCSFNKNINGFNLNVYENGKKHEQAYINYTKNGNQYSYKLKNVTSSANYSVSVRVILNKNVIGQEAHVNFTTKHIPSNPPEDIKTDKVGINYLVLSWTKPKKSFGKIIEYEVDFENHKNYRKIRTCQQSDRCSFKFSNLTSNTSYRIKIKANTESGNGMWSKQIKFQTKKLGAIQNMQIKNRTSNSFSVTWNQLDADSINYNITLKALKPNYTYANDCKFDEKLKIFISEENNYTFTELLAFYNYSVSIRAVLPLEEGQDSASIVVTTLESTPTKPRFLKHSLKDNSNKHQYNVSGMIRWSAPCRKNGTISHFLLNLKGSAEDMSLKYSETIPVKYEENKENYSYEIQNVNCSIYYSISIQTVLRSGLKSEKSYINFTSPEWFKNISYQINGATVNISWKSPCSFNKNINGFNLSVYENGKKHEQAYINYTKNGNQYSYKLKNITSSARYNVSVRVILNKNVTGQGAYVSFTIGHIPSNPPENIKADEIGINYFVLSWTKPQKSFGKIIEYEVDFENHKNYRKTGTCQQSDRCSFKFSNLTSNTSYSIKIRANTETGKGTWSKPTMSKTEKLGAIQNIQIKNIASKSFSVTWNQLDAADNINYNISLKALKPNYTYANDCKFDEKLKIFISEKNNYTFTELWPFYNYNVSIRAILPLEKGQHSASIVVTTLESTPTKPRFLKHFLKDNSNKHQYNVSGMIRWSAPCRKNGTISHFLLNLKGSAEDMSLKYSETIPVKYEENKENYSYEIQNVNSSIYYSVSIQTVLSSKLKSEKSDINFRSPEWYPEEPESVQIANQSPTQIFITWKKPLLTYRTILSYAINFTNYGSILTNFKEYCHYNEQISSENKTTNKPFFIFTKLSPYSNYSVSIQAKTSIGLGKSSNVQFVHTKSAAPKLPQNFTITNIRVDQQTGSVDLNWTAPCQQNGPIKQFTILLKGIYSVNKSEVYSKKKIVPFSNNIFFYFLHISDLIPSCDYEAEIFAVLKDGTKGKSSKKPFSLQSGIPEPPSIVQLTATENELKLSWKNSPTPVGDIEKYRIMVIPFRVPHQNSCNMTIPTYYNISIAAKTKDENFSSPTTYETRKQIHSSNDYDATLTLEFISVCDQNKPIKQYEIIVEKQSEKIRSNELQNSSFVKYNLTFEKHDNYIVKTEIELGDVIDDKATTSVILATICTLVSVIAIVSVITILFILQRKKILYFSFKHKCHNDDNKNIELENIDKILDNPNKIAEHFNQIEEKSNKLKYSTKFALLPENRERNRYTNVLPFDSTRVHLQVEENDYINASYIKGFSGNIEYIATQGPLQNTCEDFWKMILQENVTMIVMVAQFVEKNKEKCFKYIPNNQETIELLNGFKIRCMSELNFETYFIRQLQIQTDNNTKTVLHMQFVNWPDLGVPNNIQAMLEFCRDIRKRSKTNSGLIVIHCSAGVGRTGTLIATDILLQAIGTNNSISIYQTVLELRMQRVNMVQTEVQYQFIHSCVREALRNRRESEIVNDSEVFYENVEAIRCLFNDDVVY